MKITKVLTLALLLNLLLVGCSNDLAKVEYDEKIDFNSLINYNWLDNTETSQMDQLENKLVRIAVDRHLAAKGFKRVSQNPDFLITQDFSKYLTDDRIWGADTGEPMRPLPAARYAYQKARLVIEVIDPRMKSMIWTGRSSLAVEKVVTPYSRQKRINQEVAKILENFPPKQKPAISKLSRP